jgi:hypothetical protein
VIRSASGCSRIFPVFSRPSHNRAPNLQGYAVISEARTGVLRRGTSPGGALPPLFPRLCPCGIDQDADGNDHDQQSLSDCPRENNFIGCSHHSASPTSRQPPSAAATEHTLQGGCAQKRRAQRICKLTLSANQSPTFLPPTRGSPTP